METWQRDLRIKEIIKELIELQPIRQEYLSKLRNCEGRIEQLCKEKAYLERMGIKIKKVNLGASGKHIPSSNSGPTINDMLKDMDAAKLEALLNAATERLNKGE